MEYKYKYQLHTHTSPCSRCGVMKPTEMCRALYEKGYAGAVITNHFIGGNSGIDRSLSWAEFVKAYEDDYIASKNAAEEYGLDIIFGIEEHISHGLEILCYGITPALLYAHSELREHKLDDYFRVLHEAGALVIQAHPYRVRGYITNPGPLPLDMIDGVEVYNAANPCAENALAEEFAAQNPHLILTSGADAHTTGTIGCGGIAARTRIRDEKELVAVLKSGDYKLMKE